MAYEAEDQDEMEEVDQGELQLAFDELYFNYVDLVQFWHIACYFRQRNDLHSQPTDRGHFHFRKSKLSRTKNACRIRNTLSTTRTIYNKN